jgi:phospholipid transport system transporter-binding protein
MVVCENNRLQVTVPMVIANAKALVEAGAAALPAGEAVVDLSAVKEVDSSALAILFSWLRTQKARGASLRVEGAPASVRSLASMYGVDELISLS